MLIITMAKRLQAGSMEGKISKSWHLEGKLRTLCIIPESNPAVVFHNVKHTVSKLSKSITNKGVLATSTFLAFPWNDFHI